MAHPMWRTRGSFVGRSQPSNMEAAFRNNVAGIGAKTSRSEYIGYDRLIYFGFFAPELLRLAPLQGGTRWQTLA